MNFVQLIPVIIFKDTDELLNMEKNVFPSCLDVEETIKFSTSKVGRDFSSKLKVYTRSETFIELKKKLVDIQNEKIKEFQDTKSLFEKHNFCKDDINWIISTSIKNKFNLTIKKESIPYQKGLATEVIRNYIQCYKYIVRKKPIEPSDAFDLLILSYVPYVDIIITENSNAATLRLIKEDCKVISMLSILTMNNIRNRSI